MDLRLGLERGLAPGLLALPDRALARVVDRLGGRPSTRGQRLDLRASLLVALDRRVHAPLHQMSPEGARRASSRRVAVSLGAAPPGLVTERVRLDDPDLSGPLEGLLHRPRGGGRGPLVVYFHQGGFVIGDPAWASPFAAILVGVLGARVLAVRYPRAPEVRLPEIRRAALGATRGALRAAPGWGADAGRWVVGGDSAGGWLAAEVAAQLPRDRRPAAQLLVYPLLELGAQTRSRTELAHAHPVSGAFLAWSEALALPEGAAPEDPAFSPGRRARLDGLPPAVVATAGFDPLIDEGDAYAARLAAAGVPVRHRVFRELPHGFTALPGVVPRAGDALRELARDLQALLGGG